MAHVRHLHIEIIVAMHIYVYIYTAACAGCVGLCVPQIRATFGISNDLILGKLIYYRKFLFCRPSHRHLFSSECSPMPAAVQVPFPVLLCSLLLDFSYRIFSFLLFLLLLLLLTVDRFSVVVFSPRGSLWNGSCVR